MAGLDASIILQGRSPNILGAMAQGMQLREARDQMQRRNALADLMEQNGAALSRGDGNALATMSASGYLEPEQVANLGSAFLGQQATRQGMDHADRRLAMDEETMQQRRDEILRLTTADQRAQAAEEARRRGTILGTFAQGGDAAGFAAKAQEFGLDVTMADWPALAAEMDADLEFLASLDGPGPDLHQVDGYGVVDYSRLSMGGDPSSAVVLPERAPAPQPEWNSDLGTYVAPDANGVPRPIAGAPVAQPDPAEVVGPNGLDPKQQLDAENAFRDDWTSLPEVKDYSGISRAYSTIVASAQQESGAGDIALITMLGKLLDPTSVVREQEFAIAANAGGTLAWLESQADRVANGQLLTPDTRAQIVAIGTAIQREAEQRIGGLRGDYEGIATRAGMDPMDVMPGVRYSPTYTGAPPFSPVARPQSRPGGPGNAPPPTNQRRPTGQLSLGTENTGTTQATATPQGAPQAAPTGAQAGTQAGPVTIPSVDQVARMDPASLDTLVKAATAAGVTIPREVRAAIRARLMGPTPQGGR